MKKAIAVLAACVGLAAFAGAADPKPAAGKETKPAAAVAASDGGTATTDAGSAAKPAPKK